MFYRRSLFCSFGSRLFRKRLILLMSSSQQNRQQSLWHQWNTYLAGVVRFTGQGILVEYPNCTWRFRGVSTPFLAVFLAYLCRIPYVRRIHAVLGTYSLRIQCVSMTYLWCMLYRLTSLLCVHHLMRFVVIWSSLPRHPRFVYPMASVVARVGRSVACDTVGDDS